MRAFRIEKVPNPGLPEPLKAEIATGFADIEIGAGQGLHAIRYGLAHPERKLLAIERTTEKFERFRGRLQKHPNIHNVFPLHADAVSVIAHHVSDNSVDRFFLLYPNPYPKQKQRNLRWHNSPFMGCLISKLKADGRLHLSTNLKWYADEAIQTLVEQWSMKLALDSKVMDPHLAQTHFERKYLERGETCYRMIFIKACQPS